MAKNKGFQETEIRQLEKYTREYRKLLGELVLGSRSNAGKRNRADTVEETIRDKRAGFTQDDGEKFKNGNRFEKRTNANIVSTGDPDAGCTCVVRRSILLLFYFIYFFIIGWRTVSDCRARV